MAMQQYLDRYAESESAPGLNISGTYDHVLCIPAYAEPIGFLDRLTANIQETNTLVILVLNAPSDAPAQQLEQTQDLASKLTQSCRVKSVLANNMNLLDGPGKLDLLLVQRCHSGYFLDKKGGVGLARKIACDIACRLVTDGTIESPWIHITDADAVLPMDYFDGLTRFDSNKVSAGIYPFVHTSSGDEKICRAQQLYDLSMEYYVAGLTYAGSSWAYHTIGSTLVINARHYAQARGFPKRQAGEDFYLLNKLGKTGRVVCLETNPVTLESRLSNRVPFGTGPALIKILAMANPDREFLFYHPACFAHLKCWLDLAKSLWVDKQKTLTIEYIEALIDADHQYATVDSNLLFDCLQALGTNKALAHAFSHSNSKEVFDRHLRIWFDAFQTLKFIHWLRDTHYPSVPRSALQDETGFTWTGH